MHSQRICFGSGPGLSRIADSAYDFVLWLISPFNSYSVAAARLRRLPLDAERSKYIEVVGGAMKAVVREVFPGAKVVCDTPTKFVAIHRNKKVVWIDSGIRKYWNLYVYFKGERTWSLSVMDADTGFPAEFEICYDHRISTDDVARIAGDRIIVYRGDADVRAQSCLTIDMVKDVMQTIS